MILATGGAAAGQTNCGGDTLKSAAICFGKALDQANRDMQARYQAAQDGVKNQSQFVALLAKSQDAFLAYRSQTCDGLVAPYWQQGQLQDVAVLSCKLALTKARATDLENMFHGLWGLQP
jgi:uncharacterized protein YecT (DUF1311 family)